MTMMIEKMFPIQKEFDHERRVTRPAGAIPWSVAELAYAKYVEWYGNSQPLDRLAERGGFGWTELVCLLKGDKEGIRQCLPTSKTE